MTWLSCLFQSYALCPILPYWARSEKSLHGMANCCSKRIFFLRKKMILSSERLPEHSTIEVKNYWNSHLKLKLTKMGIDPMNYRIQEYVHKKNLEFFSSRNKGFDVEISDAESSSA
ncbi:hypothetical protein H5410_025478 [Solanum commersonii]|uniref:Uncharacterized protein n=1 Tax=Solanum commersonii TaxID=4109 RepID=A0A9J5YUC0_SOLCO|nr:hypothetical protein H5410_025478 [Solanum commersonii]